MEGELRSPVLCLFQQRTTEVLQDARCERVKHRTCAQLELHVALAQVKDQVETLGSSHLL